MTLTYFQGQGKVEKLQQTVVFDSELQQFPFLLLLNVVLKLLLFR